MESCICGFFIMQNGIDQKNFHDIMDIMVVNIGQHYFHNVAFLFIAFSSHFNIFALSRLRFGAI